MERMERFKTHLSCLSMTMRSNKDTHVFTVNEDAAAYYFANKSNVSRDDLDLTVLKLNLFAPQRIPLTLTSFQNRISNMSYEINKKGLSRNSAQGTAIAKFIRGEIINNRMKAIELKSFINFLFNKEVV